MEEEDLGVLVSNLASSDEAIVPTIRSVLERGWSYRFQTSLDHFMAAQDGELRKICNFHFEDFSEGINEISKLEPLSASLKKKIESLDDELQAKGEKVMKSSSQLLRFYRVQRHLDESQDALQRAKSMVVLAQRAKKLILKGNFYEALLTVDLVRELVHGKSTKALLESNSGVAAGKPTSVGHQREQDSRLITRFKKWIPAVIMTIRLNVDRALTNWFLMARDRSERIGKSAIESVQKRNSEMIYKVMNMGQTESKEATIGDGSKSSGSKSPRENSDRKTRRSSLMLRSRQSSTDVLTGWGQSDSAELVTIAQSVLSNEITFQPVYQFLDTYSYLGENEHASTFYRHNRIPQASLQTMVPIDINKMEPGRLTTYAKSLFTKIAGFFMIESSLARSANLLSTFDLVEIWDKVMKELLPSLDAELSQAQDRPEQYVELVQLILNFSTLFAQALKDPSDVIHTSSEVSDDHAAKTATEVHKRARTLDTSRLLHLCTRRKDQIFQVVREKYALSIEKIVRTEPGVGYEAKEEKSMRDCESFGLCDPVDIGVSDDMDDEDSGGTGTKEYPFTATIPRICLCINDMVVEVYSLARQIGPLSEATDKSAVDLAAVTATIVANDMITHYFKLVRDIIEHDDTSPEALCRHAVNIQYMKQAGSVIEARLHALSALESLESPKLASRSSNSSHSGVTPFKSSKSKPNESTQEWWRLEILRNASALADEALGSVIGAIHSQVNELLSSRFTVDWAPTEIVAEPHWFVTDSIQYLVGSLTVGLRLLPPVQKQAAYFTCCGRMSEAIFDVLCGSRVEEVNAFSIFAVSKDLEHLLNFAKDTGVPGLVETFAQLSQLVALLSSGDLQAYLEPSTRGKIYSYLSPNDVRAVLAKYRQIPGSNRLFSSSQLNVVFIKDSEIKKALQLL